ncbi:replication Fork Protection Component Swi3 [Ancylostoma duodenale]|uniref:TIMELESS-interacting protein n=1 Tax=Ancylostoma duodenale TaxID=51022 RepID=A0A0C2GNH5_9BILA|nr:replication Fork Protection Component Swi3 [Ancylostoma duodenale]
MGEIDDFFGNDFYSDEPAIDEEEAGWFKFSFSGPSDDQQLNSLIEKENQQVVKKSGKSRPQPKLNEATITGPKGIQALRESFKNYKPDPLKDPYENLNVMLKKYEHWAHVMFPKLKFEDVVSRCESLGDKRIVKVYMTKSRLDMPITDEDFAPRKRKGDEVSRSSAGTPNVWDAKSVSAGANSQEVDDMMEEANEASRRLMEEEQRRNEEAELAMADEIMDDFDM